MVTSEIEELVNKLRDIFNNVEDKEENSVKVSMAFYHQCLSRNRRYVNW